MLTSTINLKESRVLDVYDILKSYSSYEEALIEYINLEQVLIRLGFLDAPNKAFAKFINMERGEVYNKYSTNFVKQIPVNLPIEFIVRKIAADTPQEQEQSVYSYVPKVTQKRILELLGINESTFKTHLSKHALCSEKDPSLNFLNNETFRDLLNIRFYLEPINENLITDICNQIVIRQVPPINKFTLVKHALQYKANESFNLSFSRYPENMNVELTKFYILTQSVYKPLTFKNLQQTIENVKHENGIETEGEIDLIRKIGEYIISIEEIFAAQKPAESSVAVGSNLETQSRDLLPENELTENNEQITLSIPEQNIEQLLDEELESFLEFLNDEYPQTLIENTEQITLPIQDQIIETLPDEELEAIFAFINAEEPQALIENIEQLPLPAQQQSIDSLSDEELEAIFAFINNEEPQTLTPVNDLELQTIGFFKRSAQEDIEENPSKRNKNSF